MDTITESTFDYIKKNIFVIIDKEAHPESDDGESSLVSYLFDKPLYQCENVHCIWTSSRELFGPIYGEAEFHTFSFFDLCGPIAFLRDYYRLWHWIPNVGDCVINYIDPFIPAIGRFCNNNRELIVKAVKEVLESYNLLQDEDTRCWRAVRLH